MSGWGQRPVVQPQVVSGWGQRPAPQAQVVSGWGQRPAPPVPQAQIVDPSHAYLQQAVLEAILPVAHLETEWEVDKLQAKVIEYINKAAKAMNMPRPGVPMQLLVTEFADKFFEALWRGIGDRKWLDQVDFSLPVATAAQAHFPPSILAGVTNDQLMPVVTYACQTNYDTQRYYSWGTQVIKSIIQGKNSQKKVREAVDEARNITVRECYSEIKDFIRSWITNTKDKLDKAGNLSFLIRADAIKLFNCMVQEGGGLPLHLTKPLGGLPPEDWQEVKDACDIYPETADEVWAQQAEATKALGLGPRGGGIGANLTATWGNAGAKNTGTFSSVFSLGGLSAYNSALRGGSRAGPYEPL